MTPQSTLDAIASRDPDGGEREPTDNERLNYALSVLRFYGEEVYQDYYGKPSPSYSA